MFQHSMLHSPLRYDGLRSARFILLLIGLAALLVAAPHAEAASTKRVVLGEKNLQTLTPNCGRDFTRECTVEGKVTAFQSLSANSPGRNFEVPFDGKLVAWSISLSKPTRVDIDDNAAQLPSFNLIFGSPSQAGVSVLRQVEKKKKNGPRFKLLRRSPVQILNPYFGSKVTFALDAPLNVRKGNMIALSIPTWVPALWKPAACNIRYGDFVDPDTCVKYTWRGSRVPLDDASLNPVAKSCSLSNQPEPNEQLQKTRPQNGIGSVRKYGCYYAGNVLLYSATIVGK